MARTNLIKVFLAVLLLCASGANGQGISTSGSRPIGIGGLLWTCHLDALAASLTQCKVAPATGIRAYITDVIVVTSTTTAGTYRIDAGTGTNCATGTTHIFPAVTAGATFTAPISTAQPTNFRFTTPLQPPSANAICVIGTATNTIHILIQGFLAP